MSLFIVFGCNEDELPDPIPSLQVLNIVPTEVIEFEDPIIITVQYRDEDADLGFFDPDVNSVFVKDSRVDEYDALHIPPQAPENETIKIVGQLDIEIKNTFILGNGNEQQFYYTIKIVDRAGNESNEVDTEMITVRKP